MMEAFHSFAAVARSLEQNYSSLASEVARLHEELARSRAGQARSLRENREMRQRLEEILAGLPCGVLLATAQGTICRVNPEARRLLQFISGSSASGRQAPADCLSLVPLPEGLRNLLNRARNEAGEHEQCFKDACGKQCWIAARHATMPKIREPKEEPKDDPKRDGFAVEAGNSEPDRAQDWGPGGNPPPDAPGGVGPASVFILRDVSDAKRLVEEREKLRREQALAEMSATLAHEIRNPLGSLELFAALLAEAGLPPECCRWVEHLQAGLRVLAATVNNVLHFHSLPAPQRVPADLGRLLDWAGGFLVPMAHQAGVELRLRNELQDVWFPADRHRLEQVLLNLVLNAIRATPNGGCVEISGRQVHLGQASAVEICVSDTGAGILPEQEARIFEPGFSTRPGGPGLGLAVCRKIAEQHGGSLQASNHAGAGARFTMMLLLRKEVPGKEVPKKGMRGKGMLELEAAHEGLRQEVAG